MIDKDLINNFRLSNTSFFDLINADSMMPNTGVFDYDPLNVETDFQKQLPTNIVPRKFSSDNKYKEFSITLKKNNNNKVYDNFHIKMSSVISLTTDALYEDLYIPSRLVLKSSVNIKELKRSARYFLTDSEAEILKNNPMVLSVEIPYEQKGYSIDFDIPSTVQPITHSDVGQFPRRFLATDSELTNLKHTNWGLIRSSYPTNTYTIPYLSYELVLNDQVPGGGDSTHTYALDGTGVDFVIMDTGCDKNHPEWNDKDGISRFKDHDWFEAATGDPYNKKIVVTGSLRFNVQENLYYICIEEVLNGNLDNTVIYGYWDALPIEVYNVHIYNPILEADWDDSNGPWISGRDATLQPGNNRSTRQEAEAVTRLSSTSIFECFCNLPESLFLVNDVLNHTFSTDQVDFTISLQPKDMNKYDFNGHGTHVASTVAGRRFGWAKNANIYSIPIFDGVFSRLGIAFDIILRWHKRKVVQGNGYIRPTVINMSWSYSSGWKLGRYVGLSDHQVGYKHYFSSFPYNAITKLEYPNNECQYSKIYNVSMIKSLTANGKTYSLNNEQGTHLFFGVMDASRIANSSEYNKTHNIAKSNPLILNSFFSAISGKVFFNQQLSPVGQLNDNIDVFSNNWSPTKDLGDTINATGISNCQRTSFYIENGKVKGYGYNGVGERDVPQDFGTCQSISNGYYHLLALLDDGSVATYLPSYFSAYESFLRIPEGLGKCTQVSTKWLHNAALTEGGKVVVWGFNPYAPDKGYNYVISESSVYLDCSYVNASFYLTAVITTNGELKIFGLTAFSLDVIINDSVAASNHRYKSVSVGFLRCCAIRDNDELEYWKTDELTGTYPEDVVIPEALSRIASPEKCSQVSCGVAHSVALTKDGVVYAWGNNKYKQCDVPEGLGRCTHICTGNFITTVIKEDGTIKSWGAGYSASYVSAGKTRVIIDEVNASIDEMIDSGIHICMSAGNENSMISKVDDPSWNNKATISCFSEYDPDTGYIKRPPTFGESDMQQTEEVVYFNRKTSPYSDRAIVVGSLNNVTLFKDRPLESRSLFSNYGSGVDVYAPGSYIMGACPRFTYDFYRIPGWGKYYDISGVVSTEFNQLKISGTSMATPQVCGVCALFLQKFPYLTPAQLKKNIIMYSKKGVLLDQSVINTDFGDSWWKAQLLDGSVADISDFNIYPTGKKFSLGLPGSELSSSVLYMPFSPEDLTISDTVYLPPSIPYTSVKPLFRIDRRPLVKIDCIDIPGDEGDSVSIVCNRERKGRGLGSLSGVDGFKNLFNITLTNLYESGFRRFVLQCPCGIQTNSRLSPNIKNSFDSLSDYHNVNSVICKETSLPFDLTNRSTDNKFYTSFIEKLQTWILSLKENVEFIIEIDSMLIRSSQGVIDLNKIFRPNNSYVDIKFNPNLESHLNWLKFNLSDFTANGVTGLAMRDFGSNSFIQSSNYGNINKCLWTNCKAEFMCSRLPNIGGNLYSLEEYSKCKIVSNHNLDYITGNLTMSVLFKDKKMFKYNTEIHSISSRWSTYSEDQLFEETFNNGIIPGLLFKYGQAVNVQETQNTLNKIKNAVELAERKISLEQNPKKFSIFSEHAGDTSSATGSPSSLNNYKRSSLAVSNDKIIPIIRVNCSASTLDIEADISRMYIPAWWYSDKQRLPIDSSMKQYMSDGWFLINSANRIKVDSTSPYGTIGPEKCADSAFDQCINYQSLYGNPGFAKIDFKKKNNFTIKLDGWGDLFDHVCTLNPVGSAINEGWCRLFTHPNDAVDKYENSQLNITYRPINYLKNLFAKNGTQECSIWIKRFIDRFKWRQSNLACFDLDYIVPDPIVIYIGEQKCLFVSDFINHKFKSSDGSAHADAMATPDSADYPCLSLGHNFGSWSNHVHDVRFDKTNLGFNWRLNNSLKSAFLSASVLEEFKTTKVEANSDNTFGLISVLDYKETVDNDETYNNQLNSAIEKWMQVLIDEVVARRVYESLGSQVEGAFSGGRYAQNGFSGGVLENNDNANIHAPFYPFVNRWQNYIGKYSLTNQKSCSFNIRYICPTSLVVNMNLPWSSLRHSNIKFESLDYSSGNFGSHLVNGQWGWIPRFSQEPEGRGVYVIGSSYQPNDPTSSKRNITNSLKQNHVKYIKDLLKRIESFDGSPGFYHKLKVIFTHGINNSRASTLSPPGVLSLGDFSLGKITNPTISDGYSFDKEDFKNSWSDIALSISTSDYVFANTILIHSHKDHSIQDWDDLSNSIDYLSGISIISSSSSSSSNGGSSNGGSESFTSCLNISLNSDILTILQNSSTVGWKIKIDSINDDLILKCSVFNNLGQDIYSVFSISLVGKYLLNVVNEINTVPGANAEILNSFNTSLASLLVIENDGIIGVDEIFTGYIESQSSSSFVGFENPFTIISIEKTCNDYRMISNDSTVVEDCNFGNFPSYLPVVPYSMLSSSISKSSSYFSVSNQRISQFNTVSVNGEIISIDKWMENNTAVIKERGFGNTKKRFHAPNSSVFGIGNQDVFDDNFYIDSTSRFVYQYRCLVLRNVSSFSVVNLSIVFNNSLERYASTMLFAFEIPIHGHIILTSNVGNSKNTIYIETQNLQSYILPGGSVESMSSSIVRCTYQDGLIEHRSIQTIDDTYIGLDMPLSHPADQYSLIEILPAKASNSFQGKASPVPSGRLTEFFDSSKLEDLTIPEDISRVIKHNDLIYLWIKREMPRDSRVEFDSTLPFSVKFKIL